MQHVCTTTANEEVNDSGLLENNNHNNCTNILVCNTEYSRATYPENTNESLSHSCELDSAAKLSPHSVEHELIDERSSEKGGLPLQQLMQTDAKMEKIGSSAAKSGADDQLSGCEQDRSSTHLPVTDDEYFLLYTTGNMSRNQYDRDIRKQAESIRTLPGILDITKRKRTSTDYGRCTIYNLQEIILWDDDSKVGLCQTCYTGVSS